MDDESIFRGAGDWRYNAGVNYPEDAHMLMTEGYLRAAQQLLASLHDNPSGVDFLVYPVVFLYRHWFELQLKHLIDQGRHLAQEKNLGFPGGHGLHDLWHLARPLLEKVWHDADRPAEFDLIDAAVNDFRNFDADSQSFRYPFTKRGRPLMGLKQINLQHFSEKMEQIAEFLGGASTGMTEYLKSGP